MKKSRSSSPPRLPSLVARLLLLLLTLSTSALHLASADEVVIKNSLNLPFIIGIECPPPRLGEGKRPLGVSVVVPPGSKVTVALPAAKAMPSGYTCVGSWEEVGGVVRFTAYSYSRDHDRCGGLEGKGRCTVDVRPDGVYAWEAAVKGWVRVQEFGYRLLGSGSTRGK